MAVRLPLLVKLKKLENRYFSSCINSNDPYILSAARTPFGAFFGKLSSMTAVQLGVKALEVAIQKSKVLKEDVGEMVLGCVLDSGLGQSPSRQVAISSGLPPTTYATSINSLCCSGLKALILGSMMVLLEIHEVVAVGGIESLSNVPFILRRENPKVGSITVDDSIFSDGIFDPFDNIDVTTFAEAIAKEYKVSRDEQDEYALKSFEKAEAAVQNEVFAREMVPIMVKKKGKEETVVEDEQIKMLNREKLKTLPPDMGKGGTITAGNSANLNDGGAAIIIASGSYVKKKNLKPLARIVSFGECAVDKKEFIMAPKFLLPQVLLKANLSPEKICRWEISETFALVPLLNTKFLKLDPSLVNIHGGAISLGHPFGATGIRLVGHLSHTLNEGEFGCATISSGAGGASAIIIEKM